MIGAIGALWFVVTDFKSRGARLLLVGVVGGCAVVLFQNIKFYRKCSAYRNDPGARIDDKGLTLFVGNQPTIKWEHMSHVSIDTLSKSAAIIYGREEDVGKWVGRESLMMQAEIDFRAIEPKALVNLLRDHSRFQGHGMLENKIV